MDHSVVAYQPKYLACCLDLMAGSRLADHLVSVLGAKQSLGGEN